MKTNVKSAFSIIALAAFLFSCSKEVTPKIATSDVPQNFNVEIPNSISPEFSSARRLENASKMAANDTVFDGGAVYEGIRGYIAIGELSARSITEIMKVASALVSNNISSINYNGDNDKKPKNLTLSKDAVYLNKKYAFKMVVIDLNTSNTGLEVFWNTNPIDGIAILKPIDFDRDEENARHPNQLLRVDYAENSTLGYEKQMTVYITGRNTPEDGDLNNLKMFAGIKGNILDVYGNSNHPSTSLFKMGSVNYSFRAKCDIAQDIAVAQVILPPSTVTSLSATDISTKYSVKNIITNWAIAEYPALATTEGKIFLNKYLKNTNPPGYFVATKGFVAAETIPVIAGTNFSSQITDLSSLNFYIPSDIKNLSIGFSQ
ncbi:MAG: hypothetical protein ACKVOU_00475 [Cytophagales bacterium]